MKRRRKNAKKITTKRRRRKARARSGVFSMSRRRSASRGDGINTLPQVALSWAIVRLASGAVYAYFRGKLQEAGADPKKIADDFGKAKIIVPALLTLASAKNWLPINPPGLTAIALQSTLNAFVDNTKALKDVFDLEFLNKNAKAAPAPIAGLQPRTVAQTAAQIRALRSMPRQGLRYSIAQSRRGMTTAPPDLNKQDYSVSDRSGVNEDYSMGRR